MKSFENAMRKIVREELNRVREELIRANSNTSKGRPRSRATDKFLKLEYNQSLRMPQNNPIRKMQYIRAARYASRITGDLFSIRGNVVTRLAR